MALQGSEVFLDTLKNTQGKQLLTFVKVYWSGGSIVYSENEVLFDQELGQYSYPALINLSEFRTSLRLSSEGVSQTYQLTLDDSDGHIKLRMDKEILNGITVELYLNFKGLNYTDGLLVGIGTINSEGIKYSDNTKMLTLGVNNIVVSSFMSYKAFPGMIDGQDDSLSSKYFPFVFGKPRRVPVIQIQSGKKAQVTTYKGHEGTTVIGNYTNFMYLIDNFTGYELNENVTVGIYSEKEITNPSAYIQTYSAVFVQLASGDAAFVSSDIPVETLDVNLEPFDMNDPDGFYPGGANFKSFVYFWVNLDPSIPAEDMTDQYIDFKDFDGRPSLHAYHVKSHVETNPGKFRIELGKQPRFGFKYADRDPTSSMFFKNWWFELSVDDITGEFPPSFEINSRANDVSPVWSVAYSQFSFAIDSDAGFIPDPSDPDEVLEFREDVTYPDIDFPTTGAIIDAALIVNKSTHFPENGESDYVSTWNVHSGVYGASGQSKIDSAWALVDKYGYSEKIFPFIDGGEPNAEVWYFIPLTRTESRYLINIFQAGHAAIAPKDIFAYSKSKAGSIIPVDLSTTEIKHVTLIPQEAVKQTMLELNNPLEYVRNTDSYVGSLFVDHNKSFSFHDGSGGISRFNSENALDIIEWVLRVYTNLRLDVSTDRYIEIRDRVGETQVAFYVADAIDAFALVNRLAWEHKIGLVALGTDVVVRDLNVEPVIEHAFDVSNVELRSVELGFTATSKIITDFRLRFTPFKDGSDGQVLILQTNIRYYGKTTQFVDILSYSTQPDIVDLARFWGNRLSQSWRVITFRASIEALKLQPYDPVTFNIPVLSTNTLIGFIQSVVYNPDTYDVKVVAVLASTATSIDINSQPITDPSYWEGMEKITLDGDKRLGIVSQLDGARIQEFDSGDLNSLRPFEKRI